MGGKDSVVRRLYSLWYRANRGSKRPLAADLDAYVKEHLEQKDHHRDRHDAQDCRHDIVDASLHRVLAAEYCHLDN